VFTEVGYTAVAAVRLQYMNLTGMQFITLVPAALQLEHAAPEVSAALNCLQCRTVRFMTQKKDILIYLYIIWGTK
jgi:hypothetical protein